MKRENIETLARVRYGSGFERAVGLMQVVRIKGGDFVGHYKDTAAKIDRAKRVSNIEDLSSFFGFTPRALALYQSLGIPLRAA